MSVQAMTWVLEHSQAKLGARLVLLAIASHADRSGENAYGSVATYAEEAFLSKRQTHYALKVLREAGEIEQMGVHVITTRTDRATIVYRLPKMNEVQNPHPVPESDGVQDPTERGAVSDTSGVQPTAPEPKTEPSLNQTLARARKTDLLFEAVIEVCGWALDSITKGARGKANAAVADLRRVGAEPGEVAAFAIAWRRTYRGATLTPTAISGNWPDWKAGKLAGSRGRGGSAARILQEASEEREAEERGGSDGREALGGG